MTGRRNAEWQDDAACIGAADAIFYPSETPTLTNDRYATARTICNGCPVIAECRTSVLAFEADKATQGRYGYTGGMTPAERYRATPGAAAARLAAQKAETRARYIGRQTHGTDAGYKQHLRQHTSICGDCRDAHAARAREVRAAAKTVEAEVTDWAAEAHRNRLELDRKGSHVRHPKRVA